MPIPVCGFGRTHFSKCFKDISSYGHCALKKETYYGLKLHALVTLEDFVTNLVLTAANVDDREVMWELADQFNINQVLARSLTGLISRINSKLLGTTFHIS
jgi:hypothetical protein